MSLSSNLTNLATRMATECKSLRTLLNGNTAGLTSLTTTAKTNLVAAINELQAEINQVASDLDAYSAGAAGINDDAAGTGNTWSASKISTELASLRQGILGTDVAATLDTLDEIAAAIGDDANFATTVTTALGLRVRVDAAQAFTATQMTQARANIAAASADDVGDTTANFVTTFEAGLV